MVRNVAKGGSWTFPARACTTWSRLDQPSKNGRLRCGPDLARVRGVALEDGSVFEGESFGAPSERAGEVVFNTAITGYQEVFTDPSYAGQIVVLTNPQIGNYGANDDDSESFKPYIEGLAVREFSPLSSNWRARETAREFSATR